MSAKKIKNTAVDFGKGLFKKKKKGGAYKAMMGRVPSAITEPLFSEQNFS